MPRIGIDYTPAHEQGGGIGRYVRELTAALVRQPAAYQFRLFAAGVRDHDMPPGLDERFTWHPTRVSAEWWARIWQRARVPLPVDVFTGRIDLYHATDFVLPPTLARRTLLTVHDLSFVRVPEAASPNLKAYLDRVVPRSVRRADHILADSQATKDDLIAIYGADANKITVLLSGVDARFQPVTDEQAQAAARAKYNIPNRPYIFSVGTVQPRKNYGRLIQALAQLRAVGDDVDLVIAGGRGWLEDPIYQMITDTGLHGHVHFIGFADDADLPALYSAAALTALPSLYEGFGIPVLESMACGTPVITSNVSSLPEVAGDAALTIDPLDLDALVEGVQRLLHDTRLSKVLRARGLARAADFTWDRAAQHLLTVYDRLLTS